MEVEEKTSPIVDNPDENSSKKGKILTLLFPIESQPAEGKEVKKDKNKPPTKVVVRRLPPRLTKDAFIEEFSPLPPHDYFHFVRGDLNLGPHAFSRAYINFLNEEDIFLFKEKFDDYDVQDEKGKTYHAVVEFAPFQKIPRRNVIKKKLSKAGTLESDPKYIEFLQKLEESKNFISNPSEYFHETENSALKTKIVTTPLLEYLKRKKQKKNDLKNEIRHQRKREAEREKKRKEEEKKKAERDRRKEEKKNSERNKSADEKGKKVDERGKEKRSEDRGRVKDTKTRESLENESNAEEQLESVIPNDPAILEVVVRHSSSDKESKPGTKTITFGGDETKSGKSVESETVAGKPERKYGEFRTRLAEEKPRKPFYRREPDESKTGKGTNRKGVPDERGDNYNIGNCSESGKKPEIESRTETKETKSKFRYSEQRNRDREYRQKTSDTKTSKGSGAVDIKSKTKDSEEKGNAKVSNVSEDEGKGSSSGTDGKRTSSGKTHAISLPSRRKSLETEREVVVVAADAERKRSKSFQDVSGKGFFALEKTGKEDDGDDRVNTPENDSAESPKETAEETAKKSRKVERRIRNKRMDCHPTCTHAKDRPSIEIYRPGMGKFSKQRLEKREDRNSTSPTGKSVSPFGSSKTIGQKTATTTVTLTRSSSKEN